jgi:hypothetical protein
MVRVNTSGWIRGYIFYNSPSDKFANFVGGTMSKEFDLNLEVIIDRNNYVIKLGEYRVHIALSEAKALQKTDPYALDKCILDSPGEQSLDFSANKSQYISIAMD